MTNNSDAAAFPAGDFRGCEPAKGLTKREWFAGMALQGQMASVVSAARHKEMIAAASELNLTVPEWLAFSSFNIANAMLRESEKGGGYDQ